MPRSVWLVLPYSVLGGLSMVVDIGSTWSIAREASLGLAVGAVARLVVRYRARAVTTVLLRLRTIP